MDLRHIWVYYFGMNIKSVCPVRNVGFSSEFGSTSPGLAGCVARYSHDPERCVFTEPRVRQIGCPESKGTVAKRLGVTLCCRRCRPLPVRGGGGGGLLDCGLFTWLLTCMRGSLAHDVTSCSDLREDPPLYLPLLRGAPSLARNRVRAEQRQRAAASQNTMSESWRGFARNH